MEDAGLVVRVDHRDERGVVADHRSRLVDTRATATVDTDSADVEAVRFEPRARASGRGVLDRRHDDAFAVGARLGHAANGEVICLGTSRREDHFVHLAPEERGDLFPRADDGGPRACAVHMPARWIAEVLAKIWEHRVDDLGQ